jgi:type I site-specific restriction-modification system R (restriction) subunit
MYLDNVIKEHNLLQAIARVNRLSEGKDVGLIVDYYGVLEHLNEALEQYTDAASDYKEHLQEVLQSFSQKELPATRASSRVPGETRRSSQKRLDLSREPSLEM